MRAALPTSPLVVEFNGHAAVAFPPGQYVFTGHGLHFSPWPASPYVPGRHRQASFDAEVPGELEFDGHLYCVNSVGQKNPSLHPTHVSLTRLNPG